MSLNHVFRALVFSQRNRGHAPGIRNALPDTIPRKSLSRYPNPKVERLLFPTDRGVRGASC